ncbi:MAG: hypothetical protein O7H41_02745 [Planctomycetota bacterium]|nr:hypothetical protein [Planctomycetota bacterium]
MRRELVGGVVGGVIGALIVLVLSGGRGMTQAKEKDIKDITVQHIKIVDGQGNIRGGLSAGGLSFYDERLKMAAYFSLSGLSFKDENSKMRVSLSDFGLSIYDKNGESRASLSEDGLRIHDEEENTVLTAGYSQEDGAAVLTIKGSDGKTIWEAP